MFLTTDSTLDGLPSAWSLLFQDKANKPYLAWLCFLLKSLKNKREEKIPQWWGLCLFFVLGFVFVFCFAFPHYAGGSILSHKRSWLYYDRQSLIWLHWETLADDTTSEDGPFNHVNMGKFLFLSKLFFLSLFWKKHHSESLKYNGCWQATTNTKRRKMMVKTSSATISCNS